MKKLLVAAAGAALVALALVPPQVSAGEEESPSPLVPNLRPLRAEHVQLQKVGNVRRIRFTTNVLNRGKGPFELRPDHDGCGGNDKDYTALQHMYLDQDGSGVFEPDIDVDTIHEQVGCFTYHKPHDHWHFRDFADYALMKVRANGTLRPDPVRRSDKVSFCMMDTGTVDQDFPGKPDVGVYKSRNSDEGCTKDARSGISIGWFDHYGAELRGQAFDVTELKDGPYCLSVTLDPLDLLNEITEQDNTKMMWLRLDGDEVYTNRFKNCEAL